LRDAAAEGSGPVVTTHIYVDETKQHDYLLVASVHLASDLTALRRVVRGLLLPGQRYLHMKDEKDGRKRTIAKAFVDAGVQASIYRAGPEHRTPNDNGARHVCVPSSRTTPPQRTPGSFSMRTSRWSGSTTST
jgi:hypothetical protein